MKENTNDAQLFLEKAEQFLKSFEERLRPKLLSHQRKNTKIKIGYEKQWVYNYKKLRDVGISINIDYRCHGKHITEGHWVYYLKRGVNFCVVEEEKQTDLKNLSMEPTI